MHTKELDLLEVRKFAFWAHEHTPARKYTGEPYIVHTLAVAGLVASVSGATKEMIAAALLHDVVEDTRDNPVETRVTFEMVEALFGGVVAGYVRGLSDMSTPADGNRKVRKEREVVRLSQASAEVQTIKYADLISNTISIVQFDKNFARLFLEEKRKLLEAMNKGDPDLRELAWKYLQEGQELLSRDNT